MRNFRITLLLAAALLLAGCGSSHTNDLTGNWSGTLDSTLGTPAVPSFTAALQMATASTSGTNSYTMVTINSLALSSNGGCFTADPTETASYTVSGTSNTFTLAIQGPGTDSTMGNNFLDLQGVLNSSGDKVSGSWTMNGLATGCNGSGTFTMTRVANPAPGRGA